jgi:hypothetical protein
MAPAVSPCCYLLLVEKHAITANWRLTQGESQLQKIALHSDDFYTSRRRQPHFVVAESASVGGAVHAKHRRKVVGRNSRHWRAAGEERQRRAAARRDPT